MSRRKLVLIGAGSAMFTKGLLVDIINNNQLGPWEIGLVDIDPEALLVAYNLAKKMINMKNVDIIVRKSTDRKELLPGADIVVTTIGVGGRKAWEKDVFIPRKYGIYQPVGDTVGPGGISRAMRMIPAMKDIAEDIIKLCPNALFFNYANPMTAICRALRKSVGADVIGLCIGVYEAEEHLAKILGVPHHEVTSIAIGINHLTFIIDFRYKGKDMFPIFKQRLKEKCIEDFAKEKVKNDSPFSWLIKETSKNPFAWTLFNIYGAYPAPYDRHIVEFFPERFPNGKYYGKTLGVDIFSFEKTIESGELIYTEMTRLSRAETPLDEKIFSEPTGGEHSQILEIIDSIYMDRRKIFSVNLPNEGTISNLPPYAILEMPAVATGTGFCPLHIRDFPDCLASIINKRLSCVELTVDAALKGDRKLMVEAMLADGAVKDQNIAEKLTDELLKAHKEFLPQFF